jgi:ribonucleoside-diphosphate reductase subunit M2
MQQDETPDPLFQEETRNASLPILYPTINNLLKKQRGCFWQVHEVSLTQDVIDWQKLTSDEQHFIKTVLAFFASSDLIVNKNLAERFTNDIKKLEIQAMYHFQEAMEDIHSEMYALLIDTYITDLTEKERLFNAVREIPIIGKKAAWANKWIDSDKPYNQRLIAFAAMEGIFFSGSFCSIFWLRSRKALPGLTLSNDFISRDEGLHVEGACEIHKLLKVKADQNTVHAIIKEAVDLEIEFIVDALPCRLIGINAQSMTEYIKYVANRLMKQFGYDDIYSNVEQPFKFMDSIGLEGKSNFFETRPSQYNKLAKVDVGDPYADI